MSHPMTPLSLYTAIRAEESRTGERVLPEWLIAPTRPDGDWSGHRVEDIIPENPCGDMVMWRICPSTVPHIILGSMAAWCSERGIGVYLFRERWWSWIGGTNTFDGPFRATDALSAFGEATLAAMRAMPTKGGE